MKNKLLKRIAVILIIIIAILLSYRYIVEAKVITLPNGLAANLSNRKKTIEEYLNKNEEKALGDSVWVIRNTAPDAGWTSLSAANKRKVLLFTGISEFNTYCLDHAKYLNPQAFTIKGYVKIVGDKAMGYRFVDNNVVKKPKDKEYIQDDANLVLARILHDGSYAKGWSATGKRQLGLWRYMPDTWMDKVGSSIIPSSFKHEYVRISSKETQSEWNNKKNIANSMITEMSKNLQNYMPSEIINEGGIANVEKISGGTIAGPFKVAYKGTIGGIHVLDVNENEIDSSNITILKEDKTTEISSAKKIQSGENFYIKNTSNNSMGSLLINMRRSTIITARLWFLRGSNTQDILKVMTSEEKEDLVSLKIAIGINRGIIIEKVDSNDSNNKIEDAEFIIKDKEKGWIYERTEEEKIIYDYTEDSSEAKRFRTGKNGIAKIDNLPSAIYQIYEVSAPYGYRLSEQDNYDPNNDWVVIKNTSIVKGNGAIITDDNNSQNGASDENQELRIVKAVGLYQNGKIPFKITVTNNSNSAKQNLEVIDENVDNIAQLNGKNKVGEILTASLSEIYENNNISYEWFRITTDSEGKTEEKVIENEINSTYEIKQEDVGSSIGVTIKINNTANVSTLYTIKTDIIKNNENEEDIITYKNEVRAVINTIEAGRYEEIYFNHTVTDDDNETGYVLNVATLVERTVRTNESGAEEIEEKTYTSNETSTGVELIKLVKTVEANENGVITYKVNVTNNSTSKKINLEVTTDESIDNIAELQVTGKTLTVTLPETYAGNIESYEWLRIKTDSEGNEYEEHIINNNSTYEITSDDVNSYIVATIKVKNNNNYSTLYTVQTDVIKDENVSNLTTTKTNASIIVNEIEAGQSLDVYYNHTVSNDVNNGNTTNNETNPENNGENNQENNVVNLDENDILLSDNDVVLRLKITNKNFKGNLKIIKKDSDIGNALSGAQFKVKRIEKNDQGNITAEKWINLDEGKYVYEDSSDNAYKFTTDSNGIIDIKDIEAGTYMVYETLAPEGYKLEIQSGYNSSNNWVDFNKEIEIEPDQTKTMEVNVTNFQAGTITVIKKDGDKNLEAGFKIYSVDQKGWLSGKIKDEYKYDNTFENAEVYYNKAENNYFLTLDKIRLGTYQIYEVEPPEGYNLKVQANYDSNNNWVPVEKVTLNSNNTIVSVTKQNEKGISISGYVWLDADQGKNFNYNNLYDDEEARVKGVTVNLVNKTSKQVVATAITDENGMYTFADPCRKEQLKDHYIEFNYKDKKVDLKYTNRVDKDQDISKFIPVAFNSANENEIVKNGSRAIMDNVAERDEKLSGIATTYTGTEEESKYGLGVDGNIYKKLIEDTSLNNINLGLKMIPDVDYKIDQSIAYLKIVMNGYNFTYYYGNEGNSEYVGAPRTSWQKVVGISGYRAPIYPSYVAEEKVLADNGQEENLKVYVVYRTDIQNTTTLGTGDAQEKMKELYQEKKLVIGELKNYYDTSRYSLERTYDLDDNNEIRKDFNNWRLEDNKEGTAIYDIENIKNGIEPGKTISTYIEFKVNRDAIIDILNHPNGIREKYPTKVEASKTYHEYSRMDYSWKNNITANQNHIKDDENRAAEAPYLVFQLGEERIFKGKVFKDEVVTKDGQVLGNGKYDTNENVISGIKVELIDIANGNNVGSLYKVQQDGTVKTEKAEVYTDKKGEYSLNGLVPGRYLLRFTYGDGSQKIYDVDGKEIKTIESAKDYKSTIVTNDYAIKALQGNENITSEWYKNLDKDMYSVAIDNLNTRIKVNEGTERNISADTAKIGVTIENDKETYRIIDYDGKSTFTAKDKDGNEKKLTLLNTVLAGNNTFGGLSFGIIEQPKQDAEIEKIITNIKLTTIENKVEFNGNPETMVVAGINDLDFKQNGGSSYVEIQILENLIYGSTIEITYQVKITNKSDLNYYNEEYYLYGDAKDKSKEILLKPTEVIDYLDNSLTYVPEKSESERIKSKGTSNVVIYRNKVKAQAFELTDWKTLYTNKNKDKSEEETTDKVIIVAQRILSNENDSEVLSKAEITKAENVPYLKEDINEESFKTIRPATDLHSEATARLEITPPQGEDRSIYVIYAISGIIALTLLSTGIVIIKKKIL